MDTVLQALFSWQFVLFCLATAAATFVVRKIVEFILDNPNIPASKTSKFWTDLFLPIFPVIGASVGAWLATGYPFPEGMTSSSSRIIFGLVAGLLSGLVYRIAKSFLSSKLGIAIVDNEESNKQGAVIVADSETAKLSVVAVNDPTTNQLSSIPVDNKKD